MNKPSTQQWETVHTINDWYDGPRLGIADYNGEPHLYESRWDSQKQEWEGQGNDEDYVYHYWLSPTSPETFELAVEDWAIWERWEAAFHRGETDQSTHPALPADRSRHDQLKPLLEDALKPGQSGAFVRIGKFEREGVRWSRPGDQETL